jgi:serine/threonine protein kinase
VQPETWKRVEELFEAAKAESPALREQFLQNACPDSSAIRSEVQALLDAESTAESFLEGLPLFPALAPGTRFGHFAIEKLIGRGGMGEVYRAQDTRLHRTVAIKIAPAFFRSDRSARPF